MISFWNDEKIKGYLFKHQDNLWDIIKSIEHIIVDKTYDLDVMSWFTASQTGNMIHGCFADLTSVKGIELSLAVN